MANFDRLAKIYEPLELLTFAGKLQQIRCFCLSRIHQCKRGLLIGDGDGRFSSELLRKNLSIHLDSIDISPLMHEVAQSKAGSNNHRLRSIMANAIDQSYPIEAYDFIGLHFSLDCFTQDELDKLLPHLKRALKTNGIIAYSDFQAKRVWQRLLVKALYFSFQISTGLRVKRLPVVDWGTDFQTIAKTETLGGLIFSQVLRKL